MFPECIYARPYIVPDIYIKQIDVCDMVIFCAVKETAAKCGLFIHNTSSCICASLTCVGILLNFLAIRIHDSRLRRIIIRSVVHVSGFTT